MVLSFPCKCCSPPPRKGPPVPPGPFSSTVSAPEGPQEPGAPAEGSGGSSLAGTRWQPRLCGHTVPCAGSGDAALPRPALPWPGSPSRLLAAHPQRAALALPCRLHSARCCPHQCRAPVAVCSALHAPLPPPLHPGRGRRRGNTLLGRAVPAPAARRHTAPPEAAWPGAAPALHDTARVPSMIKRVGEPGTIFLLEIN